MVYDNDICVDITGIYSYNNDKLDKWNNRFINLSKQTLKQQY